MIAFQFNWGGHPSTEVQRTDRHTQTPEGARLLSQQRRPVLLMLGSHYHISHLIGISWSFSVNVSMRTSGHVLHVHNACSQCVCAIVRDNTVTLVFNKDSWLDFISTSLCFFLSVCCNQCSLADTDYWETRISSDCHESRQQTKLLRLSRVCVCLYPNVCLTSGTAFLLCSIFSRLRLASKHSGHTRLVLLSKVFEHFAQMACRRTDRGRESAVRGCSVVNS